MISFSCHLSSLLFCLCPSLSALFASFLSSSEGFSPSPCAGCWPPSTTGGLRPWCFVSPGRTRLTWQPNQVEFLQVRKFSRRVQTNPNNLAINVYFLLLYIFQYAYHLNSTSVLCYCCFLVWWNEHAMNTEALPHIKPFHVTTVLM